ncbi:SusC/RagA family TonB-linked outer membrane protein [Butyricimonas faecihominis]|uniref:SusC/RagA family TonB-linked outer membrane protein n=1 Tax=Butyricimonas faecihominis TaxID=1472416 RepID=UPI0032BF3405
MRLTLFLTLFFSFTAIASVSSQSVTLKLENASLRETIKELRNQTGVYFVFNEEEIARLNVKLNMVLTNEPFEKALDRIFEGLPFSYEYAEGVVVVKPLPQEDEKEKLKLVKGKVVDTDGLPLPGVSVVVEGTTRGVASDVDGLFQIMIENKVGQKLLFSFVGMEQKVITWQGQDSLHVVMKYSTVDMDEVVVTGYQTVNRRESASAVSVVKTEEIYMAGAASIDQMLQGQIPGLMVINTSGEPSATPKIRIRGTSTINGNKAPVWVVDGVILEQDVPITASDLNSEDAEYLVGNAIAGISPQDIESITVLKDASATAIYGVKAANGVIVLTTKKGKIGKPTVSYHGEMVVNQRPSYRNFDLMNSSERMTLSKEVIEDGLKYGSNISLDPNDSYEGLVNELVNRRITHAEFSELAMAMAKRNTDWFDILFRNAVTHNHTLSVQGGNEQTRYYFSAGYNNNQGAAQGSLSERFTTLAKVDVNLGEYVNFMTKIDYSTTKNDGYTVGVNPFSYAYKTSRTLSPYEADGSYHMYKQGSAYEYNILKELDETGQTAKTNDFNALLNLNVKLIKNISYQGTFSFHNSTTEQKDWQTEESNAVARIRGYNYKEYDETEDKYWESSLPYGGILTSKNTTKTGYTVRNALNYVAVFGDVHDINIYVGSELRGNKYGGTSVTGYGWTPEFGERFMPIYTDRFTQNYAAKGKLLPTNTNTISRVASFFGTASYTYANRYVLNFNIRSDGANKFGSNPKYRWLPTWSVAGKWTLTNESFLSAFADKGHFVSIRGSYGVQGNIHDDSTPNLILEIGDRNETSTLEQSTIYRLPNPDLRWEKTSSWNVAVDFSFWSGRLSGSVDVYKKHTDDLIIDKIVAASNGKQHLFINAGEMNNTGVEGNLSVGLLRSKLFDWNFNVNFGRNTNEVILANDNLYNDLEKITEMLNGNLAIEGEKLGMMYSFAYAGLSADNGYPLFYGQDGKKYHGGDPTMMKLVKSGSINPDLSGGFDTQLTFKKRLSLSIGFAYSIGGVKRLPAVYDDNSKVFDPLANVSTDWKKRWRKSGDELKTDIPALYNSEFANNFRYEGLMNYVDDEDGRRAVEQCTYYYDKSDHRVAKADYLRLRLIGLSYAMPGELAKKIGASSMMLRFQATNLHVWASKKWQGLDPETPDANIPVLPAYSFGINVSF